MAESDILSLFYNYKNFYLEQITNESDTEIKQKLMSKVINDLMEQNELLLEILLEVHQNTRDRSEQMHQMLTKTASKTSEVGQALTSYELEVKTFAQNRIPAFIDFANYAKQMQFYIINLEHDNQELKKENETFFRDLQMQNVQLINYRKMFKEKFDDGTIKTSTLFKSDKLDEIECFNIESFLHTKFNELSRNINTIVCADVLEDIITITEKTIEDENNFTNSDKVYFDCNSTDINDNYEIEECSRFDSELICSTTIELKSLPKILFTISSVYDDLEKKISVIYELKRELLSIREKHSKLQNSFIQMGLQTLNNFRMLEDEIKSGVNGLIEPTNMASHKWEQTILNHIENGINQVLQNKSIPQWIHPLSSS